MNEFSAVSAEELDQVEGGLIPVIIAAGALVVSGCIDSTDDIEDREPLPGFNKFLEGIQRLSGPR